MELGARARSQTNSRPAPLRSWKEIASYLGLGIRTVQRYERELGLPVRRVELKTRSKVRALRSEIDVWWLEKTQYEPPAPLRSAKRIKKFRGR